MSKIDLGLESILRTNGNFFKELTEAVQRLRDGKKYDTKAIKESMIPSVIRLHTGMNVSFVIIGGEDASAYRKSITNFNGLNGASYTGQSTAAGNVMSITNKDFVGLVDEVNGRVGGDFSKVPVLMEIGIGFLGHNTVYEADEAAAIILHELGHLFASFQFLGTFGYGGALIARTARMLLDSDSINERKVIVKKLESVLGVDKTFNSVDYIENPKPGLDVLMLADYVGSLPIRSLNTLYDFRNVEQQADQFLVRHGAALAQARALDKTHRRSDMYGQESLTRHLMAETARLFALWGEVPSLTDLLFKNAYPKKYDDPNDRIEYLKMQLIDDLKRIPKNNELERNIILNDIKEIEKIHSNIVYRRDVIQFFWDCVSTKGKDMAANEKLQKSLERMLYNDLFLKATQFKANRG